MAIPDYQSIMLPLLKFIGDGKERSLREAIEHTVIQALENLNFTSFPFPTSRRLEIMTMNGARL